MGAIYGIDIYELEKRDRNAYVGLWLNRQRGICRQSLPVRYGVRAAATGFLGPMKEAYYLNVADNSEEAKYLQEVDSSN
jgi:hypothetical protein